MLDKLTLVGNSSKSLFFIEKELKKISTSGVNGDSQF